MLKPLSLSKDFLFKAGGVFFVYFWSFYSHTTYTAFLLGIFSTLFAEVYLIWQYLRSKIQKESGKKINIELGNFNVNFYKFLI